MQKKAAYISQPLYDKIGSLTGKRALKMEGLLSNLSTFEYSSTVNLEQSQNINSIFAVLSNIIHRGTPTLLSPRNEVLLSKTLNLTERKESPWATEFMCSKSFSFDKFVNALHPIDNRYLDRSKYLNKDLLESAFEIAFLHHYIPENKAFLAFLFESQRTRESLGAAKGNQGRVDFNLEIPYNLIRKDTNRYHKPVNLKYKRNFIVEVDGERYHNDFVDSIKDFQLASFNNNISHIREANAFQNSIDFIRNILQEPYIKLIQRNANQSLDNLIKYYVLLLSPIGIARTQSILMDYLLSLPERKDSIKIAIIERDVPCGSMAIEDLKEIGNNIESIQDSVKGLPEIDYQVFNTDDFKQFSQLQHNDARNIDEFKDDNYDLVLEISLLSRFGVINYPTKISALNYIKIANVHSEQEDSESPIISATPIIYKPFVTEKQNENYEDNPELKPFLNYLITLLFRKNSFRVGQLPILNRAMQRKSVIGLLPTGGGKSLTYQFACLMQPGIAVIVDPIRSLMLDQFNSLSKVGVHRACYINSTVSSEEKKYYLDQLTKGKLQFVFVSPERYVIKSFRESLSKTNENGFYFSYGVLDEVHCVSEWGHDFRTDYLNLGKNITSNTHSLDKGKIPLFGLTATASYDVLADIERELEIPDDDGKAIVRYENTVRDEVNYFVQQVNSPDLQNIQTEFQARNEIGSLKQNETKEWINSFKEQINRFNTPESIKNITEYSYDNYYPDSLKDLNSSSDKENYIKGQEKVLRLENTDFGDSLNKIVINGEELETTQYNDAFVIFCPHKSGAFGVTNVASSLKTNLDVDYVGTFMGSSDSANSRQTDELSFKNQEDFIANKSRVMVATKAFGMGIDKPNVRSTIHMNIPQSIESFVQETGRSGRDKKLAMSLVLFNNQRFETNEDDGYNVERNILEYFHKKSFKGKLQELQTIYEIRNSITYPRVSNLDLLTLEIKELFKIPGIRLNYFGNQFVQRLYVKDENVADDVAIIDVNACTFEISGVPTDLLTDALNHVVGELIRIEPNDREAWLKAERSIPSTVGIENTLEKLEIGEKRVVKIYFNNQFHTNKKDNEANRVNHFHETKFLSNKQIQLAIQSNLVPEINLRNAFRNSILKGKDFVEFIEGLSGDNKELYNLLNTDEVNRVFHASRNKADTAKAIYRLSSIGVIDDYTIDFQNGFYEISFSKKKEGTYFKNLQKLLIRYTSKKTAKSEIKSLKNQYLEKIDKKEATEIGVCIKYVTDFIYDKVADKRIQAINDMIDLCNTAIKEKDPLKQNRLIKDQIYYYFNAKYSRKENYAIIDKKGTISASLVEDKELVVNELLDKYIYLPEKDTTASFKTNIKHLRGACMRMLRVTPNHIGFLILRGFSSLILADFTPALLQDAQKDIIQGFVAWLNDENIDNVKRYFNIIREKVMEHTINETTPEMLNNILNTIEIKFHSEWLTNFNKEFIKNFHE